LKKFVILLSIITLFIPSVVSASPDEEVILKEAKSGVLMEASTGKIIYEKNSHEKVAIASLTKMVAQIIILENIEKGIIKWEDIVTASSNAAGMGGTQIFLTAGEKMSVKDLFKGISMASANEVVVVK
jgi:D-alanyl-D-alanine carboxypeptidase